MGTKCPTDVCCIIKAVVFVVDIYLCVFNDIGFFYVGKRTIGKETLWIYIENLLSLNVLCVYYRHRRGAANWTWLRLSFGTIRVYTFSSPLSFYIDHFGFFKCIVYIYNFFVSFCLTTISAGSLFKWWAISKWSIYTSVHIDKFEGGGGQLNRLYCCENIYIRISIASALYFRFWSNIWIGSVNTWQLNAWIGASLSFFLKAKIHDDLPLNVFF